MHSSRAFSFQFKLQNHSMCAHELIVSIYVCVCVYIMPMEWVFIHVYHDHEQILILMMMPNASIQFFSIRSFSRFTVLRLLLLLVVVLVPFVRVHISVSVLLPWLPHCCFECVQCSYSPTANTTLILSTCSLFFVFFAFVFCFISGSTDRPTNFFPLHSILCVLHGSVLFLQHRQSRIMCEGPAG